MNFTFCVVFDASYSKRKSEKLLIGFTSINHSFSLIFYNIDNDNRRKTNGISFVTE